MFSASNYEKLAGTAFSAFQTNDLKRVDSLSLKKENACSLCF
jgi:hypothetical protein